MIRRLTKRYIVKSLQNLNLSSPLRYERYYINNHLRIQKKNTLLEKEELDDNNEVILKKEITETEFNLLKSQAYQSIIRDSYLYLDDNRISIKTYYATYEGLNRVEVQFITEEEMKNFHPLPWMDEDITETPLAFDVHLSKLNREEFVSLLNKHLK